VGSFGEQLRQAREAQHITLQEIAATTKISCRALQALEDERFDQLPGGIFNKGFVRAYARYVGLDEEKMLAAYLSAAKVESAEPDMQAISSQVKSAPGKGHGPMLSGATLAGVLALLVALGVGALWLKEQRKEWREQRAAATAAANAPAPVAAAPTVAVAPVEPATAAGAEATGGAASTAQSTIQSGVANPSPGAAAKTVLEPEAQGAKESAKAAVGAGPQPVEAASKATAEQAGISEQAAPVEVTVTATKRAWMSVHSDGKPVETLTLDPDKPELRSRSYKAREKLTLKVGNAAGLTVTYNGKPVGKLGGTGDRATLTFTPQGMEKE
jgi:cytoskeleton protein RodZ